MVFGVQPSKITASQLQEDDDHEVKDKMSLLFHSTPAKMARPATPTGPDLSHIQCPGQVFFEPHPPRFAEASDAAASEQDDDDPF